LSIQDLKQAKINNSSSSSRSTIDIPVEIYSITDRDIERSGLTSIPELLRLAPGLHVAKQGSNQWAISSRGFSNELNQALSLVVDGRRAHTNLFPAVYWDMQDTLLSDIKRIEVVRGAGANVIESNGLDRSVWTDNALNGVVNVITKRPAETQGKFINIIHGTSESIKSARYGGKIDDDMFYRIYAKNRIIDSGLNIDNHSRSDDWRDSRSGFRIDWEDSVTNQYIFQGDIFKGNAGYRHIHPSIDLTQYIVNDNISRYDGLNLMSKWLHNNNGNKLALRGYYDHYSKRHQLFDQEFNVFDVDLQYIIPKSNYGENIFGLAYRVENSIIDYPYIYGYKYKKNIGSLINSFIQNKINIIPKKLSLTTSFKIQHEDDMKRNEYSNTEFHPTIRGNLKLTNSQSLWAGIAKTSRNPTISERFGSMVKQIRDESPRIVRLLSDEDFKSEELISYELGYRNYFSKSLFIESSIFFNQYDNLRTYEFNSANASEVSYKVGNQLYGESYGLEISSKIGITNNLDIALNYTFLKTTLHQQPNSTAINPESDEYSAPKNQFSVRSYYDFFDKFSWNNILFYAGSVKNYNIKSYFRFDSNISLQVNNNVKLTLVGQNLFNNRRQESAPFIFQENSFEESSKIYAKINIIF
ncbi:TonB-dependent receptor, partial [Rickettsiales bacterium]|nr:TonB-dependent receptor [Rickettsiales bacterium]